VESNNTKSKFPAGYLMGPEQERVVQFRQLVLRTLGDLFAAYGVSLKGNEAAPESTGGAPTFAYLGVAGFRGPYFNGYIVLEANEAFLRHTNPTTSSCLDWMGELANQFLGRVKNRLLREGIQIQSIPPLVAAGHAASSLYAQDGATLSVLSDEGGSLLVWMKSQPVFDLPVEPRPPGHVPHEGDVVLF
jgi:hypothetical protein